MSYMTIFKNVNLLTESGAMASTDITVVDDRIVAIGETGGSTAADRVIDGSGKLAIAGFVNTHTHAAMTLFRSYADDMLLMDWLQHKIWPAEANLVAEDVYIGTQLAIAEMIKSGTTTFTDMYFFMPEVARAVADSGIRAVLCRGMAGVAPTAEQALVESEAFFREYHQTADGRIRVMLGPHAPYTCPPAYLKKVVALAQKLGAEIHIHLSETKQEVEDCQREHGKSPIALMNELEVFSTGALAAHCVWVSDDDIAIMKDKKVRVAHNPVSNMKLASGIAPVPAMLAAGLAVGLGTDGASSNNNLDMLKEMRMAALLHKVQALDPLAIPAATAYKMATEYGAQAVGLGDITGSLQVGYKADIVLLDTQAPHWYPRHDATSLLTYAAHAHDVHTVMINGKIVMENRVLTTIDEEKLLHAAEKSAKRLIAQA